MNGWRPKMTEWVDDDEVTITYRTLRQGLAEAVEGERNRIVQVLLAKYEEYKASGDLAGQGGLVQAMNLITGGVS
jgi:hypothetical protein